MFLLHVVDSDAHSCLDLTRIKKDADKGDRPLWFGEWSLATEWSPNDEFFRRWADAQKLAYSDSKGWIVSQIFILV